MYGEADDIKVTHRVLFTMGLGGSSLHWQPQIEFFEKLPGFQLCCYDNRGIGHSDPVAGRWTTRAMARDALSLLNHLGWREKIHIVGLSMGGMITQELALLDTERFASISLLSTIAGGLFSLQYFALKLPTGVQTMGRAMLSSDPRTRLKAGLMVLYPESHLDEQVYNQEKDTHETNFHALRRALIARGVQEAQEGAPKPTAWTPVKQTFAVATHRVPTASLQRLQRHFGEAALVVTGDSDILVHHANSGVLKEGLGATLLMIENAGHGAAEQNPIAVNQALLDNFGRGEAHYKTARSKL